MTGALDGRVVLVTGSSRGIGAEVAVKAGDTLVLPQTSVHFIRNTGEGRMYSITLMSPDDGFAGLVTEGRGARGRGLQRRRSEEPLLTERGPAAAIVRRGVSVRPRGRCASRQATKTARASRARPIPGGRAHARQGIRGARVV